MLIIAHRGACNKLPENSKAAIRLAASQKFDGIEFDVRMTKDKYFLVIHDAKLNRMTNSIGRISKKYLDNVKTVKLRNGEFIPTLDDVLKLLSKDKLDYKKDIFVEIKDSGHEKDILALIKKYSLQKQVVITSFSFRSLHKIRMYDKNIRLCMDQSLPTTRSLRKAAIINCYAVGCPAWTLRKKIVTESKRRKILLLSFQIKSSRSLNRAIRLGVDGVFLEKYVKI